MLDTEVLDDNNEELLSQYATGVFSLPTLIHATLFFYSAFVLMTNNSIIFFIPTTQTQVLV